LKDSLKGTIARTSLPTGITRLCLFVAEQSVQPRHIIGLAWFGRTLLILIRFEKPVDHSERFQLTNKKYQEGSGLHGWYMLVSSYLPTMLIPCQTTKEPHSENADMCLLQIQHARQASNWPDRNYGLQAVAAAVKPDRLIGHSKTPGSTLD